MNLKERSLLFRQAVNESIRSNSVHFEDIGKDRLEAHVAVEHSESFTNDVEFGWFRYLTTFEIEFTPDQLDYNGVHVFQDEQPWRVDWKTYQWAVRKLSQYHVMYIIGDEFNE